MDAATCPSCSGEMDRRRVGQIDVLGCQECRGLFLDRADLGRFVEAELDWHAHRSADTAQLPRISADMTVPPPAPKARSYLDSLFRGR